MEFRCNSPYSGSSRPQASRRVFSFHASCIVHSFMLFSYPPFLLRSQFSILSFSHACSLLVHPQSALATYGPMAPWPPRIASQLVPIACFYFLHGMPPCPTQSNSSLLDCQLLSSSNWPIFASHASTRIFIHPPCTNRIYYIFELISFFLFFFLFLLDTQNFSTLKLPVLGRLA